jgi:hypothetical protein
VGAPERPRRFRSRARITAVTLLVGLLAWWMAAHVFDGDDESTPPAAVVSRPPDPPASPVGEGDAERIAREYESTRLAGKVDATCRRDGDPSACRAGFGSAPVAYVLSNPVHVLESQPLRGGGVGGQTVSTAVLVAFAIQGQQERRVALLVRDGLVIDREPIGSDNAGKTLADLFGETS